MDTKRKIEKYIEETLPVCTRERKEDDLEVKLYGLPYPYSVPSAGHFDELYYWDTYFLNMMFRFNGQWHQMKNNADDMLYMVERFGYMGNSNRMWHLKTSQPPFLSEIVKEVYQHYNDKDWLGKAYKTLQKESAFEATLAHIHSLDLLQLYYKVPLLPLDVLAVLFPEFLHLFHQFEVSKLAFSPLTYTICKSMGKVQV